MEHVFSKHGTPADIVSNQGTKFTSDFWREFSQALGIQQKLSTALHPETDGQTKWVNSSLEAYCNNLQTNTPGSGQARVVTPAFRAGRNLDNQKAHCQW